MDRIRHFTGALVPPRDERRPVTSVNAFPVIVAPWVPVILASYLSRKRDAWLLRRALVLAAPFIAIPPVFGFVFDTDEFRWLNWVQGMLVTYCIIRTTSMCLAQQGVLRTDEKELPKSTNWNDAWSLFLGCRGFNWKFGTGMGFRPPPFKKPLEPSAFVRATALRCITTFLAVDLLDSFIKLLPCSASPRGGTIFLQHLPPLERYLLSTATHLATGLTVVFGFTMLHEFSALVAVGLLEQSPSDWPPMFDAPWRSTSISDFWARRWHQILRSTFMDVGGLPLEALSRSLGGGKKWQQAGSVMGAFAASGALHDFGMWTLGGEVHHIALAFFLLQGLIVLGERAFRDTTGQRVGGWWGRAWAYFIVLGVGQLLIDSWHRQGVMSGILWFPSLSPTRQILYPLLANYISRFQAYVTPV